MNTTPMISRGRLLAYFLIFILAAGSALVGFQMFKARVELNTSYPDFSSFAADPKGYRVLFETLSQFKTLRVERFVQPFGNLPAGAGKTLLLAGIDPESDSIDQQTLDHWSTTGGSLIVALKSSATPGIKKTGEARTAPDSSPEPSAFVRQLADWGLRVFRSKADLAGPIQSYHFRRNTSWSGRLYFETSKPDWQVIAKARDLPVVVQKGKIIVLADSEPLSNARLANHRNTELVSWLFPQHSTILFDESHLGIINRQGIMSLARRYGLDGAFIAILGLGIVYIWAVRYRLIPPHDRPIASDVVGASGNEILINLLHRAVPKKDLCATCLDMWRHKGPINAAKRARLDSLLGKLPPADSPMERYNQIVEVNHS
jgi:hypothetical protein